jgi:hypothetical protein
VGRRVDYKRTAGGGHAWPLLVILGVFLVAVVIVNPLRETPVGDDSAYCWTVRHLLDTGEYRLHDWVAPNMPFQAYWGAAFAVWMPGFFGALRCSTLVLSLGGMCAFYGLAIECRLQRWTALLLTLVLFSSYLYFRDSFSFMTDVTAVAWSLMTVYCFAVWSRQGSTTMACLGTLAACAGVLTRQSCVALPGALMLAALVDLQRQQRWRTYLLGGTVPLVVFAWSTTLGENFAALEHHNQLREYWSQPCQVAIEGFWRINEVLLCLAVLALPFALTFGLVQLWKGIAALRRPQAVLTGIVLLELSFCAVLWTYSHKDEVQMEEIGPCASPWLPHLQFSFEEYYNGYFVDEDARLEFSLSQLALIVAAVFWPTLVRHCNPWRSKPLLPGNWLLECYALASLGFLVFFLKLLDRYTTALLPVLLLVLGRAIEPALRKWFVAVPLGACLACVLVLNAMQTGAALRYREATWYGSQLAYEAGVPIDRISGSDEWVVYHSFDRFVTYYREGQLEGDYYKYYWQWLWDYCGNAQADMIDGPVEPGGWPVLVEVPYRDIWFQEQVVSVVVEPSLYGKLIRR